MKDWFMLLRSQDPFFIPCHHYIPVSFFAMAGLFSKFKWIVVDVFVPYGIKRGDLSYVITVHGHLIFF